MAPVVANHQPSICILTTSHQHLKNHSSYSHYSRNRCSRLRFASTQAGLVRGLPQRVVACGIGMVGVSPTVPVCKTRKVAWINETVGMGPCSFLELKVCNEKAAWWFQSFFYLHAGDDCQLGYNTSIRKSWGWVGVWLWISCMKKLFPGDFWPNLDW